jgi:hypothetical protein
VILFTLAAIQFVGLVVETVLEDSFYGLIADVCERCKDSVCRKNDDVTASPAMKTGVTSPLGKLSKAFREPPRWPRGPLLRRENRHRWGEWRFGKPSLDAQAAPPCAHESLVSRETGAEVPLTGLSFGATT